LEWSLRPAGTAEEPGKPSKLTSSINSKGLIIHQKLKQKFTVRGVVRGGSLALCAANVVGCGLAYTFGKRDKEAKDS
jgi:hypothetical protein